MGKVFPYSPRRAAAELRRRARQQAAEEERRIWGEIVDEDLEQRRRPDSPRSPKRPPQRDLLRETREAIEQFNHMVLRMAIERMIVIGVENPEEVAATLPRASGAQVTIAIDVTRRPDDKLIDEVGRSIRYRDYLLYCRAKGLRDRFTNVGVKAMANHALRLIDECQAANLEVPDNTADPIPPYAAHRLIRTCARYVLHHLIEEDPGLMQILLERLREILSYQRARRAREQSRRKSKETK